MTIKLSQLKISQLLSKNKRTLVNISYRFMRDDLFRSARLKISTQTYCFLSWPSMRQSVNPSATPWSVLATCYTITLFWFLCNYHKLMVSKFQKIFFMSSDTPKPKHFFYKFLPLPLKSVRIKK